MKLSIGKNIQTRRRAKHLTQEEVAHILGVSGATVSKWESESSFPDILLLAPLARLLDTTINDLLRF